MYNQIECPHCGNVTTAKSIPEEQKCKWCRRLFKVNVKRNKKKKKCTWSVEPIDFQNNDKPRIKSIDDYMYEDIYGRPKQ